MRVLGGLALAVLCAPGSGPALGAAAARNFNESPAWRFECRLDAVSRGDSWCIAPTEGSSCSTAVTITWHRDRGVATLIWGNGDGKGLREVQGFSDGNGQHTVHFWYSPATAKYTAPETAASRYGGWVEGFGPGFVSLRITGEAAMTTHDIIYGGMKALTREGRCTVEAIWPERTE